MNETEKKIGKIKSFAFDEVKVEKSLDANGNEVRKIKGYANKATIDRGNDLVLPEAYSKTMDEFMKNPLVFFNHDWDAPIGKISEFEIKNDGLYVTAIIAEGLDLANKVWKMIEQGILKAFSIGFIPKEIDYDSATGAFIIKELELLEVSVVTIPMNAQSLFEMSKGMIKSITMNSPAGEWVSYKSLIGEKIEEDNAPQLQKFEFIEGKCSFCPSEGKNLTWGITAFGEALSSCTGCFIKFWDDSLGLSSKESIDSAVKNYKDSLDKINNLQDENEKLKHLLVDMSTKIGEIVVSNIAKK